MENFDSTFQILKNETIPDTATNTNSIGIPEIISDLHLEPITPVLHFSFDIIPEPFWSGGVEMANLDALFNFSGLDWKGTCQNPKTFPSFQSQSGSKTFWDLSRGNFGASEYWLWRNPINVIIREDNVDLTSFRKDIDFANETTIFLFEMYDWVQPTEELTRGWFDWVMEQIDEESTIDIIGSTDPPTNFNDFYYLLSFALMRLDNQGWFFFPLPNDTRVENTLSLIRPVCNYLTTIRIVSSPYSWVVGRMSSVLEDYSLLKEIEKLLSKKGKATRPSSVGNAILPEKYYNLKRLSTIWRIPYSRPQRIEHK